MSLGLGRPGSWAEASGSDSGSGCQQQFEISQVYSPFQATGPSPTSSRTMSSRNLSLSRWAVS